LTRARRDSAGGMRERSVEMPVIEFEPGHASSSIPG
jgi:hypothetical protein